MDLQTYCEKNGGTARRGCPVLSRIADETGYSAETLYMVALGHKQPGGRMAGRLADATGQAVTLEELRPDFFGGESARAEGAGA